MANSSCHSGLGGTIEGHLAQKAALCSLCSSKFSLFLQYLCDRLLFQLQITTEVRIALRTAELVLAVP